MSEQVIEQVLNYMNGVTGEAGEDPTEDTTVLKMLVVNIGMGNYIMGLYDNNDNTLYRWSVEDEYRTVHLLDVEVSEDVNRSIQSFLGQALFDCEKE